MPPKESKAPSPGGSTSKTATTGGKSMAPKKDGKTPPSSSKSVSQEPKGTDSSARTTSGKSKTMSDGQKEILMREHDKAMREERRRRLILIVVIIVCLLIAIALIVIGVISNKSSDDDDTQSSAESVEGTTGSPGPETAEETKVVKTGSIKAKPTTPDKRAKELLPNLTAECVKQHGDCFYHLKREPDSCKNTTCTSVHVKYEGYMHAKPVPQEKKIKVPEHTYCGEGKWCENGNCVPNADERLKEPDETPHPGGWRHNCDERKCVEFDRDAQLRHNRFWKCPTSRSACERAFGNLGQGLKYQYLSLNDPLPVRMNASIALTAYPRPLVIYNYCPPDCPWRYSLIRHEASAVDSAPCSLTVENKKWIEIPAYWVVNQAKNHASGNECLPLFLFDSRAYGIKSEKAKRCG